MMQTFHSTIYIFMLHSNPQMPNTLLQPSIHNTANNFNSPNHLINSPPTPRHSRHKPSKSSRHSSHIASPGLTHLSRAIYGLTLCARWGGGIGPVDQRLYRNLQALVDASNPGATFWAGYVGAVAAAFAWLVPAMPRSRGAVDEMVR